MIVDKPGGMTSHDVVARVRRIAGTRRVGHAGTLDPMATGVLVLGVERATKLLGHLALTTKSYDATIRLGQSTLTDDAEGDVVGGACADRVTEAQIAAGVAELTGDIEQVPSQFSAIKIDGRRSYARVRAGEVVDLPARPVTVTRFAVLGLARPAAGLLDVRVQVDCTTGTYIRALARDLGAGLGVGGHLTALRRTRVGSFGLDRAVGLAALAELDEPVAIGLDEAVLECFPRRVVTEAQAVAVGHGGRLAAIGLVGPYGVFDPAGHALALMTETGDRADPVVVLRPA